MSSKFNITPATLPSRQRNDDYLTLIREAVKAVKDKPANTAVRLEYVGHKANTIYQQGMRVLREHPELSSIVTLSKRTVGDEQITYAIRRGADDK